MQKVSKRKNAVLEILDVQIKELEAKLAAAQPFIDELAQLKRTRATLLNERGPTGTISSGTRLTMEEVIHTMTENGSSMTPQDLATKLSVDVTVVRSHLNRYKDERYRKNGDGSWQLIGGGDTDDEDDE